MSLFARKIVPSGARRRWAPPTAEDAGSRTRAMTGLAALLALAVGVSACGSNSNSDATTTTLSAQGQANRLIEQGLQAASIGQPQQAIADFQAAITKDPTNPLPYYDLGVIYQQKLNQPTTAAEYYNKAILADPTDKPAIYNLAILETSRDPGQAVRLYEQILRLSPNDADVLFNLGLILVNSKATAATGKSDIRKAIHIDPSLASRVPKNIKL